ncbi:hypothetical protein NE237_029753 [Protea cynaroides]|uniref:Uncharacterized protein n=1 Tax=Protea cynaroides TaxID=273540 RepID=A0A9Q0JV38_9MAGN|nr:hypothetical protein NE237_029753 [Protea cynaroides]
MGIQREEGEKTAVQSNGGTVTMSGMEQMELMKSVVYEMLRIDPPVPLQYGKAKKDLVIQSHDAGSQKFSTPPKKGEGDLPMPMSMEESIEAIQNLGTYPHIEQWWDRLRQWFSSIMLNPLLNKIETSHTQVMQSAVRLGITITVNQVGSGSPSTAVSTIVSPIDGSKEWQPAFKLDEDGMLHQLHATLVQAIDASMSKFPFGNLQQPPQQNFSIPVMQECVDAITEHQRLHALMKGEWVKGLHKEMNDEEGSGSISSIDQNSIYQNVRK